MMPTFQLLPVGACPTTEPRAGGQAPVAAAAGLGEAAGLTIGLAAGDAAAAGLAAGEAGAATGAAGDAGAAGFGASAGFVSVLAGAVGAVAVDGAQAATRMPDHASSNERRDILSINLSFSSKYIHGTIAGLD